MKRYITSVYWPYHLYREHNTPSLRALDSYLKEKLITWLSPAALELHRITWNDPASLLEKIVAYEVLLSSLDLLVGIFSAGCLTNNNLVILV